MALVSVLTQKHSDTANELHKLLKEFVEDFQPYTPLQTVGQPNRSVTDFTQFGDQIPAYFQSDMSLDKAKDACKAMESSFITKVPNDTLGRWEAVRQNIRRQEAGNADQWINKLDKDLSTIGKQIQLLRASLGYDTRKVAPDEVKPPAHQ